MSMCVCARWCECHEVSQTAIVAEPLVVQRSFLARLKCQFLYFEDVRKLSK